METIDNLFHLPKRYTLYLPFANHKMPSKRYILQMSFLFHTELLYYNNQINYITLNVQSDSTYC